jgi:hypothetical protein
MLRHIGTDWEKSMQEIVQIYATVADDLVRLDALAGSGPDPDFEITLQRVRNSFDRGQLLYNQCKVITPKGNQVVQTQFGAYRVSTSITFGLLRIYYDLLPWINNEASNHREEAVELATVVRNEYVPWFLVMRDIPVVGKSNHVEISTMIRRMADKSAVMVQESRLKLDQWSAS